jgi:5-methylcytosine-specific restriction protein B
MAESETGWDGFVAWARKFWELIDFDAEERDYKVEMVRPLQAALLTGPGPEWVAAIRRSFGPPQNIVVHYAFAPVIHWAVADTADAWAAVHALWESRDADAAQRLDEFDKLFPQHIKSGPGVRLNIAAFLLGAVDPTIWPNYRVEALKDAFALTRFPDTPTDASMGDRYVHTLQFFDAFINEARARELPMRDRLDAQGLMWAVTRWAPKPSGFDDAGWDELLEYRTVSSPLRKPTRSKAVPKRPTPPPQRLCPLCGINGEVRTFGRAQDGSWKSTCSGGPGHDDPFDF